METSRDDVGIAIRSAFLSKGTKQRFSLFILIIISILIIFVESIETKPLSMARAFLNDVIYRSSAVVSFPGKIINNFSHFVNNHLNLYNNYEKLIKENDKLRNSISKSDFLELENSQLRKLINEEAVSSSTLLSARVMLDEFSPYLNSFVINIGSNKNIKNGMAVMDGNNFIGRIVDVNFFSSRVLLVSDLNSKIPILSEPSGNHAILSGHGTDEPSLEYLPENHNIKDGDTIYTSGKEGIFDPGLPIGKVKIVNNDIKILLFSNLNQITFVNIKLVKLKKDK
jgi:rod shape-determining protein MreC